jgi:PAS domain S-box-containing protein
MQRNSNSLIQTRMVSTAVSVAAGFYLFLTKFRRSSAGKAITQRTFLKTSDEAVARSEAKFRAVFEQAALGIGRVNFSNARWMDVNTAFCDMLGRSKDEMLTLPWTAITHPDDVQLDLEPFKRMARGELESYSVEKRFIHKNGHHVWARLTLSLVRDTGGQPDYEIAIIQDITQSKRAHEELRMTEKRFRSVMESMSEGLMLFDCHQNLIYQNPASLRIHGFDPQHEGTIRQHELPTTWNAWDETERPITYEEWPVSRVFRHERFKDQVLHVQRVETGQKFFASYNGCPIYDTNGHLVLGFITIREITNEIHSRKRVEKLLKEQEDARQTHELIMKAARIGTYEWDVVRDQHHWSNETEEFFGYEPGTFPGTTEGFILRVHPDDRNWVSAFITKLFEKKQGYHETNYRAQRPDGSIVWLSVRGVAFYNSSGKPTRILGVLADITEQHQAQELIKQSEERLALALDATRMGVWEWFPSENRLIWSDQMKRLWDYEPGEFSAKLDAFWARMHPEDLVRVENTLSMTFNKKVDYDVEYRLIWKDSSVHWIHARGKLALDQSHNIVRMIGTAIEITQEKEAELALEGALRTRDEFISIASHELKTPLTSMQMQMQMLNRTLSKKGLESVDPKYLLKVVNVSIRQMQKLDRLVEDMLDISRINTGRLSIEKETVELGELVQEVVERFREQLNLARCEPRLKIESGVIGIWDRFRIDQVLSNLISNVIKYAPGGPVEITLKSTSENSAYLSIRDHGAGIPREAKERIFDRFERAVSHTQVSGLGLGLFIVGQILKLHGGSIRVQSELGQGSEFIVELPLMDEEPNPKKQTELS